MAGGDTPNKVSEYKVVATFGWPHTAEVNGTDSANAHMLELQKANPGKSYYVKCETHPDCFSNGGEVKCNKNKTVCEVRQRLSIFDNLANTALEILLSYVVPVLRVADYYLYETTGEGIFPRFNPIDAINLGLGMAYGATPVKE